MSFQLGVVEVRVFEDRHYLETVFIDGTTVPACPHDTDEYRRTAQGLGYGDDTWTMCMEHELAHTLIAQLMGLPYSPTLWAVAHGRKSSTSRRGEMAAEEEMVLAYQRWRNFRGESIWMDQ